MPIMQRAEPVEREVIRILHKRLHVPVGYRTDAEYLATDLNPANYSDLRTFKSHYVVHSFLRKWKGLDAGLDLKKITFDSWRAAEHRCHETNVRLEFEATTGFYSIAPRIISDAQRKIASILGRPNLNAIDALCGHSSGATFDLRRGSNLGDKILKKPTITRDCIDLYLRIVGSDTQLAVCQGYDFEVVRGNRAVMVPKSAKTHRTIAAEPTLNTFVQQGIGKYIRKMLLRAGVDLNDQTINQDYAFRALVDGLTTIDLSSASDTLCRNLVKLLLPPEWVQILEQSRSPSTLYEGRWYHNQKFSSMGNSYTFELESLVFYALCWAVCKDTPDFVASIYGDDIVVRDEDSRSVREVLNWAGFQVNEDKSFTDGSRFYESCGKHFYDLEDVTPPYQKEVCQYPHDFIRLHNRLVRAGLRLNLRNEFRDACLHVAREYRRRFKVDPVFGPLVESDAFFISDRFDWGDKDSVKLRGLVERQRFRHEDRVAYREAAYYYYKLRRPDHLNIHPKGWVAEKDGDATYIFKNVRVWRSSCK